jgi:AraC-like DNA-binding protein
MEKIFFHVTVSTPEKYGLCFSPCRICSLPCSAERLETLRTLLNTHEHLGILRLRLLLLETLTEILDRFPFERTEFKNASPLVRSLIGYIEENLSIRLTVTEIAGAFYLSESKIRTVFRRELGIPIGRYIDDMVFLRAEQMLSDPQTGIGQVSTALGFCDQFYFSRRFKEKFSVTPSKFKQGNTAYGPTPKKLQKPLDIFSQK